MHRVSSGSEMLVYIACVSFVLLLRCQPGQCACSKMHAAEAEFATGSVLFHGKKCWLHDDVVLLSTRKTMQNLIPTNKLDANNDEFVPVLMEYFRMCFSTAQDLATDKAVVTLQLALADAIGGYLHYYVIPVTIHGFYTGNVRYEYAKTLVTFYEDLKAHLNTHGELWARPMDASRISTDVIPIFVPAAHRDDEDPCSLLITNDRTQGTRFSPGDNGFIPLPYLDDKLNPKQIAVPFRSASAGLYKLMSPSEANILEKYYVTSIQCLRTKSSSAEAILCFKRDFSKWLKQAVVPHLRDCQLYPAFGGSLRLLETTKRGSSDGSEQPTAYHIATGPDVSDWLSKWPVLVGVVVGVVITWLIGAMCCICIRRKKANAYRRLDVVANNDDDCSCQFINTFVQVFYDFKESCCKRIAAKEDDSATNAGDDGCNCDDNPAVGDVPSKASKTQKAGKGSSGDIAGKASGGASGSKTAKGSRSKTFESSPVSVYHVASKTQSAPLPSNGINIHQSKTYSVHKLTTQSRNPMRDSCRDVSSSSSCELGSSDEEVFIQTGLKGRLSA